MTLTLLKHFAYCLEDTLMIIPKRAGLCFNLFYYKCVRLVTINHFIIMTHCVKKISNFQKKMSKKMTCKGGENIQINFLKSFDRLFR
jgi:hypothetical protein